MEPVTHFLTGACLGRSGFNRKTAYATLAMTLAAEAPDLDVLWGFHGPVAGFEHHRGITHTLVFAPVIALVTTGFVWLVHRWRKKPPAIAPRWFLIWLFALIADLSHLLLDFTNNYGIRPFFPFDAHWHAWSIVFIFDPEIFLALLLALVMPWIFGLTDREIGARKKPFRGRGWAIAALSFVVIWWGIRNAEHAHAMEMVRNGDLTSEPVLRVAAEPHMADPFAWHALMETQDYYQTAEVGTLHNRVQTDAYSNRIYKPPVTAAVAAAKQSYLGRVYLDWSSWPLTQDMGDEMAPGVTEDPQPGWHTVEFRDLRFADGGVRSSDTEKADRRAPLSAWTYVGAGNEIEGMFMSGREQK
ncbi:metal-dependent hydrolase [Paracidobacterium acidisoli]|uniref:Metal-dependent hydrolase n=1 Tax=Paracidobacterium acidisoli TaxID=2303751 RepID=A0A372ILS0_9BACT|nr:metal-dependent hydrolase [Paracidobacterium acidisoli]MBT9332507.1 metal-dependent hydrolase [Paracidobacterium acidisoli]